MGQIKVTKCPIEGLYIIEPAVHGDNRGYPARIPYQDLLRAYHSDYMFP